MSFNPSFNINTSVAVSNGGIVSSPSVVKRSVTFSSFHGVTANKTAVTKIERRRNPIAPIIMIPRLCSGWIRDDKMLGLVRALRLQRDLSITVDVVSSV